MDQGSRPRRVIEGEAETRSIDLFNVRAKILCRSVPAEVEASRQERTLNADEIFGDNTLFNIVESAVAQHSYPNRNF